MAVLDVLFLHGLDVLAVERFFHEQLVERAHTFLRFEKTAEKVVIFYSKKYFCNFFMKVVQQLYFYLSPPLRTDQLV